MPFELKVALVITNIALASFSGLFLGLFYVSKARRNALLVCGIGTLIAFASLPTQFLSVFNEAMLRHAFHHLPTVFFLFSFGATLFLSSRVRES